MYPHYAKLFQNAPKGVCKNNAIGQFDRYGREGVNNNHQHWYLSKSNVLDKSNYHAKYQYQIYIPLTRNQKSKVIVTRNHCAKYSRLVYSLSSLQAKVQNKFFLLQLFSTTWRKCGLIQANITFDAKMPILLQYVENRPRWENLFRTLACEDDVIL